MNTVQALDGPFNTTSKVADFWTPILADFSAPIDNILDAGHFALDERVDAIAGFIRAFLATHGASGN